MPRRPRWKRVIAVGSLCGQFVRGIAAAEVSAKIAIRPKWPANRSTAPERPLAGNPRMFVWPGRLGAWFSDSQPHAATVEAHRERLRAALAKSSTK